MYGQQFIPQFNQAGYQPQQYPAYNQQPAMQMQQMRGRVVSGEQDIQPSDVSMDGSRSYFPTQDGSAIYVRQVDSNLRMHSVKYVPEVQQEAPDVNEAIAALARRVEALEQAAAQPEPARRMRRKEAASE